MQTVVHHYMDKWYIRPVPESPVAPRLVLLYLTLFGGDGMMKTVCQDRIKEEWMGLVAYRNKFRNSGKHGSMWIIAIGMAVLLTGYFGLGGGGRGKNPEKEQAEAAMSEYKQAVAKVGEVEITRGQVTDLVRKMSEGREMSPMQKHFISLMVLQSLEEQTILAESAKTQGIKVSDSDVKAEIKKRTEEAATAQGIDSLPKEDRDRLRAELKYQFPEDDVRRELYIQRLSDKLKGNVTLETKGLKPEEIEVNARHILISWKGSQPGQSPVTRTQAQAEKLAKELLAKAQANQGGFADLAKEYSDDQGSKPQGGDLGWFNRMTMVTFADAAFNAKPGSVVGPVKTQYGYHIIKVEDRRVSEARQQQEVTKFLNEQKKKMKMVVLAPDFKAAQAYQEYQREKSTKDKKAAEPKRLAALSAYETAIKERPRDPVNYAMLGIMYHDAAQYQKALDVLQKGAALQPPLAQIQLSLGDVYRKMKQPDKALNAYKLAGRYAGSDADVHRQLLIAYEQMKQRDLAKAQMQWLMNTQQSQGPMMPQGQ